MNNIKDIFVEPEAVHFWGELYTLYYGNVCSCYLPTVTIIDLGYTKLITGICKDCGLYISARETSG